jgi:hypothetical protein
MGCLGEPHSHRAEHRSLAWEMAGRDGEAFERLMWTTWLTNPAGRFHGGDEPPPSTWAAVVLSAVGCGWQEAGFTRR